MNDSIEILIRGVGRFNRVEKLLGLSAVEHVAILDDMDPGARLDEFKALKNGWLDGKGVAPAHKQLDWLSTAFQCNYPDGVPLPYLYPTAEGGVQAEWSLGNWEITLEIDIDKCQGQWHALEIESDSVEEESLNLNDPVAWHWLTQQLSSRLGDPA